MSSTRLFKPLNWLYINDYQLQSIFSRPVTVVFSVLNMCNEEATSLLSISLLLLPYMTISHLICGCLESDIH